MDEVKKYWVDIISEAMLNALYSVLESLRHFLVDASLSIGLIGGAICILFYVAGWEKGMRYTGILFVAHVLIRGLLG